MHLMYKGLIIMSQWCDQPDLVVKPVACLYSVVVKLFPIPQHYIDIEPFIHLKPCIRIYIRIRVSPCTNPGTIAKVFADNYKDIVW